MTPPKDEPRWCEHCETQIPPARVKALPATLLCFECSEKLGGDFVYTAKQENLAKPGSLKLNYGGVSISKTRRRIPKKDQS